MASKASLLGVQQSFTKIRQCYKEGETPPRGYLWLAPEFVRLCLFLVMS